MDLHDYVEGQEVQSSPSSATGDLVRVGHLGGGQKSARVRMRCGLGLGLRFRVWLLSTAVGRVMAAMGRGKLTFGATAGVIMTGIVRITQGFRASGTYTVLNGY